MLELLLPSHLVSVLAICRHEARQHIGQLSKEAGAKLKSTSDSDRNSSSVSEMLQFLALIFFLHVRTSIVRFDFYEEPLVLI